MDAITDLIALVADSNMENTLRGLLSRYQALGIRPITYDIFRHDKRDPGCWTMRITSSDPTPISIFMHWSCLTIRDRVKKDRRAPELEIELEYRLQQSGWDEDRARVVVLEPELEIWVWSDSPLVDTYLGWEAHSPICGHGCANRGY